LWLLAGIIFLVLCAPARADVFDDNPAAVSMGAGNVYVFVRGSDGTILSKHLSGGTWGAWTPIPGLVAGSGPGAVVYGDTIMLFARGSDGAAWQNTLVNGNWTGWTSLGGGITSAPAAGLRIGTGAADLVVRGTNNALYHRAFTPGAGWTPWETLGGNVGSGPTVTGYTPQGTIDVLVRDATGALFGWYWDANGWHGPSSFGGIIDGAPTSTFPALNWLDIYARASDDTLWHFKHPGGAWHRVNSLKLDSAPAATSDQPGHEYIFARVGSELQVMQVTAAGTANAVWNGFSSLGPIDVASGPAPAPPPVVVPQPLITLAPVLSYKYRSSRRFTRLTSLIVRSIPAGSTVVVRCRKGCSAKKWTRHNVKGSLSLRRFIRHSLRVGTKITVTVSKPGAITAIKTLKVRARRSPSVSTRCLPPGASKPQHC
jgi:hypothetical protein